MLFDALQRALNGVRALLTPRALNDDMQSEMREHLDRATERFMARGLSRDGARTAARREFGNMTVVQEEARDARGTAWMDALRGDLRPSAARHR